MRNIEKAKNEMYELAKQNGCEILFDYPPHDDEHLSSLWYGGEVAQVKFPNGAIGCIDALGDVYATLNDPVDNHEISYVKDKGNNGNFYCEMNSFIKNDDDLTKKINNSELVLDNNNWWEISVVDKNGDWHDLMWCAESDDLYDAISECISGLVDDDDYENGFVNL